MCEGIAGGAEGKGARRGRYSKVEDETLANKNDHGNEDHGDECEDDNEEEGDEDEILREIKASGISKSDMARMAPWVRIC